MARFSDVIWPLLPPPSHYLGYGILISTLASYAITIKYLLSIVEGIEYAGWLGKVEIIKFKFIRSFVRGNQNIYSDFF